MRHLHENFHKKFKHPDLGILLWQAARATTEDVYIDTIKKMRDIDEKAVDWLLKEAKPEFWVECYFEGNDAGTSSPASPDRVNDVASDMSHNSDAM